MMFFREKKSLIDVVDGYYLSNMTEEEFSDFCDIPTTELAFALGYYMDNLLLPQRRITIVDRTFLKIHNEFQRILDEIKNDNTNDNWKIHLYSSIIPKICLADHYRKEIDKEYQKEFLDMNSISTLIAEINDFYLIIQNIHPVLNIDHFKEEIEKENKKKIRIFNPNKNSL